MPNNKPYNVGDMVVLVNPTTRHTQNYVVVGVNHAQESVLVESLDLAHTYFTTPYASVLALAGNYWTNRAVQSSIRAALVKANYSN